MESITIKVDSSLSKQIEKAMKHGYSTKTEFIREAIRDKAEKLTREELVGEFLKFRGKAGKKTTYADNRKTREEASRELMAELQKRFK